MDVSLSKTIHELMYGRSLVHMDEVLQKLTDKPREDKLLSEKAIADIVTLLQKGGGAWGHASHAERDQLDKIPMAKDPSKTFTLTQIPNAWNVLLFVNNFSYVEGDDFSVDRDSRQVVWKRDDIELSKDFADEIYFLYHVNVEDGMEWVAGEKDYCAIATDEEVDEMIGEEPGSWIDPTDKDYMSAATTAEVKAVLAGGPLPTTEDPSSPTVPASSDYVSAATDKEVADIISGKS